MGENSAIAWTDHTYNHWIGCAHAGPGCDLCYAEAQDKFRGWTKEGWGPGKPRKATSHAYRQKPLQWNRRAALDNIRYRVFGFSLADLFDNEVDPAWRAEFFDIVRATTNLVWMLLTKRIGNAPAMLPDDWGDGWAHVWIGATMTDQKELERDWPKLARVPAAVRFVSHEPGLGRLDLGAIRSNERPDLVITGGESNQGGKRARPFVVDDAEDLGRQCAAAGSAFFCKQLGSNPVRRATDGTTEPLRLVNRTGEDMAEWPETLRVREMPPAYARRLAA